MITNRDIEIAFVRAQNRINEKIEDAQAEFMLPDAVAMIDAMIGKIRKQKTAKQNDNNPLMNEEI